MFSNLSKWSLAKATIFKNTPIYVQFYITARCNLTCKQCNIIYANSDVKECTNEDIKRIADNFATLGVAIVLLTGGEPFVREDLPEIILEFEKRGIHVRMQTNGLATEEQIHKAVEYGGKDISISLDSLAANLQDEINGGFKDSWYETLKTISLFTKYLPKDKSFASFGSVLQRSNYKDIIDVIKFGTSISWFTSLVPVHISNYFNPMGFRTFDKTLGFTKEHYDEVDDIIERIRNMRKEGYLLYDSDQYLDDIKRFVKGDHTTWRSKNENVCDSPNLYFAVLPNGEFAPCCDHRIKTKVFTQDRDFPKIFMSKSFREEVFNKTKNCIGCMYGSYPEITISMRFLQATLQRVSTFFANPPEKKWPVTYEDMLSNIDKIKSDRKQVEEKYSGKKIA